MKHYPNFGLKVIKITTKSDLDKDHYLIFPPITKNHYYIKPQVGPEIKTRGPIVPLGPLLGLPMFKNLC